MTQVTISPKFQVVIPKEVRERAHLRKGQKMTVVAKGNMILFVPDVPLKSLRGFAKGVSSEGLREKKERSL